MALLPSNKEWSMIRNEVQRFMPDTVSIINKTSTYSSENGEQITRTVASTTKARVSSPNGSEQRIITDRLIDEGTENIETAKLYLPYGTSITTEQEILTSDGKYWSIVHTNSSQGYTSVRTVLLYRRKVNNVQVN